MAIVKMKKLRLMVVRAQKDALLDALVRLGCVQITDMDSDREELRAETGRTAAYKAELSTFTSALKLLDKLAPAKKKLLSPRPEISADSFLGGEGYEDALRTAEHILELEQKTRSISAEESRLRALVETLTPWATLELPLETGGTKRTVVLMGTMPTDHDPVEAEVILDEVADEAELFTVSSDEKQHYVVLLCMKERQEAALQVMKEFSFAQTGIGGFTGTAAENLDAARRELASLAESKASAQREIIELASRRDDIRLCADRAETALCRAEAEDRLSGSDSTVCLTGWITADGEEDFIKCAEEFDCAWETEEPLPEEYPEVPVKLRNNKVTDALNMVTNMYALPTYDGVDPNPLMAPFFILFYGLMMADMGYGLLMIIAAIVAIKKIKPKEGTLSFCRLLLYGGIATFAMGAVTGGFFGNALEVVGQILGKEEGWGVLPALFNPMTDSMTVLIGAMILGLIHLNTGMVINVVEKCKRGEYADAFWEEGALWITLAGILLTVFVKGAVSIAILVIGCLAVLYGGARGATGIGKVLLSVFKTIYDQVTGWFGDILSYARIMALMLAGSVIGMVFNTIGGIANNLLFFTVIFLIGHALNFGLNLLGCYVHDLRLQCLEYFGKFYKDGGKPFRPVRIKTKYYDVTE